MPRTDPSNTDILTIGSSVWNIADGFTKIKILKLLIEMDNFETIAMFGYQDIEIGLTMSDHDVAHRRVEGLHRMLFILKQVIGNCKFAIKEKPDKEILDRMLDRLKTLEQTVSGIATHTTNAVSKEHELIINEQHFSKCFDIMREIKDELNFPINHAGIIFRQGDEINLDQIMKDIEEGG